MVMSLEVAVEPSPGPEKSPTSGGYIRWSGVGGHYCLAGPFCSAAMMHLMLGLPW